MGWSVAPGSSRSVGRSTTLAPSPAPSKTARCCSTRWLATIPLADNRDPADAVRGLRLAIPTNEFFDAADPDVLAAWQAALGVLEGLGAELREITFPGSLDDLFGVYRGIQRPEATVFHSEMGWLETRADRYSPTVRANLEAGARITASEYIQAQRRRRAFTDDLRATLAAVEADALLTPTQPLPPPRIDALDTPVHFHGRDETPGYLMLRNTFAFDLTGQPALALPCGFTRDGLPASLQIVAAQRFGEPTVLRLGHAYQRATTWHTQLEG
jgi:aspartyl-tRNA(Asn)/glutamyl-tRNA(Gln) amidotransferase subunit A